jgi:hypothetical protein
MRVIFTRKKSFGYSLRPWRLSILALKETAVSCHEALPCDELGCIASSENRRLIEVSPKKYGVNLTMNHTREGFLMNTSRRIPRIMVKALAAGAVLVAAALPLAIATAAGAATITNIVFTVGSGAVGNTIGTGASGTFVITGTAFAGDGSNTTVTSTAPGLTFTNVAEANGTTPDTGTSVTGSFASTSATTPGNYTLTVTDDSGTFTSTTTASGVVVVGAPTITTVTPAAPVTQGNPAVITVVTIVGTGFVTGATVSFTNTTDGTVLTAAAVGTDISGGKATSPDQGTTTFGSATSLTVAVSPTNSITGGTEAPGTYSVAVTNPNGGTSTDVGALTVIPYGVTNVSPSALPFNASLTQDTTVTIAGAGFEPGAGVTLGCSPASPAETVASSNVVSASSITAVIAVTDPATAQLCSVTVANPLVSAGGNAASYILAGALGIGEASTVAPTITATNATTGLVAGAPATTVTLTGTGFSQYSTALAFVGTGALSQSNVILSNPSGNLGTAITFNVSDVGTGSVAGPYNVVVKNTTAASNAFPAALSVAGPVITSQTPTGIAVGAPVGTVVTLTGTGFTSTTNGSVVTAGGSLRGIVSYVSATTENLVLIASPNATDLSTPPSVVLTQVPSAGTSVASPSFLLKIDAAPVVTGLTYVFTSMVRASLLASRSGLSSMAIVLLTRMSPQR